VSEAEINGNQSVVNVDDSGYVDGKDEKIVASVQAAGVLVLARVRCQCQPFAKFAKRFYRFEVHNFVAWSWLSGQYSFILLNRQKQQKTTI
jgi:hypothetical protein